MGTLIMKHWLIVLPTTLTGLYLLRLMIMLNKQKKALQPAPVSVRKKD
jgi:hypothetical protein